MMNEIKRNQGSCNESKNNKVGRSLALTGKMIMNQVDYNSKDIIIRNLTYNYKNIDSNTKTYEILREKKAKSRAIHLDMIEDYNDWKDNYSKMLNEKLTRICDNTNSEVVNTKESFINKLLLPQKELEAKNLSEIEELRKELDSTLFNRRINIEKNESNCQNTISEAQWTSKHYITNLKGKLIDIGYILEEDVIEQISAFTNQIQKLIQNFNINYIEEFKKIYNLNEKVNHELRLNFQIFVKKWKNVKLNLFIRQLESNLFSKHIVDNDELYILLACLKEDQVKIYNERLELINNITSQDLRDLNQKQMEKYLKMHENIYSNAQKLYDIHTNKLVSFSEFILSETKNYISDFFKQLQTINYKFGISNSDNTLEDDEVKIDLKKEIERLENEMVMPEFQNPFLDNKKKKLTKKEETELEDLKKKYEEEKSALLVKKELAIKELKIKNKECNVYIECKSDIQFYSISSVEEMMGIKIDPIINSQKEERTLFFKSVINFIDDFDEYSNNISIKIINLFMKKGKHIDSHYKNLNSEETKFLLEIAKAEDNDEDTTVQLEEDLNKIINSMKESVHKEEVDEEIQKANSVLDNLEQAYRRFFEVIDSILNSHEGKIKMCFDLWEKNILTLYGIFEIIKKQDIEKRRQYESEFLTAIKLKLSDQEKENEAVVSKDKKQLNKNAKADKGKNDNAAFKVEEREILSFISLLNNDYLVDATLEQIVEFLIKNSINNRDDDICDIIPKHLLDKMNSSATTLIEPEVKNKKASKTDKNKKTDQDDKFCFITDEINILEEYNPFQPLEEKIFLSPIMKNMQKALFDDNKLNKEYLFRIINDFKHKILTHIKDECNLMKETSKKIDIERKEDYLSDLDIRLKSINPRKGKIQVEEYDIRVEQIEKHKDKYAAFEKSILDRNNKDNIDNIKEIEDVIMPANNHYLEMFNKLLKSMETENSIKGLNNILKKYKSEHFELENILEKSNEKLNLYSNTNPENLLKLANNFLSAMIHMRRGGTYSTREIQYYTERIENIKNDNIKNSMESLVKSNKELFDSIKSKMNENSDVIDKKYSQMNELLLAVNCVGKLFGRPKRQINEISINIKMKINQGLDGISQLIGKIKLVVDDFDHKNKDLIREK